MSSQYARVEREIAGLTLTLETGQMARQAHGSVIATLGGTKCFAAICAANSAREDQDFFPLTVDYREKTEAAGKIPGGFFKREGRPTTKEILTMRLIDRAIRPQFPEGYKNEVQVMSHALCYDGVTNADVTAMIASFAATHISGIPFYGAMGAVRIGHIDGQLVAFPPDDKRKNESRLDLVVAGHKAGICMVEAGAKQLPEADMINALEMAHQIITTIAEMCDELRAKAGKPMQTFDAPKVDAAVSSAVERYRPRMRDALMTAGKQARHDAIAKVSDDAMLALLDGITDEKEKAGRKKLVGKLVHDLIGSCERQAIVEGRRADGRKADEIREITIVPNFVPRVHGSCLFTRGETQAHVTVTLGTTDDEAIIDGIDEEYKKNFYLHYNFPPYSVVDPGP